MKAEELKLIVKDKYGEIALQSKNQNQSSCCGSSGCCDDMDYTIFSDDYSRLEGYNPDADLGLGCGLPTEYAGIKKADYLAIIEKQGFSDSTIHKEKQISIPDEILANYLSTDEIDVAKQGDFGIFSITVNATKPL